MKTDVLEISENQTLNIGLKLFLSDKINVSHLFMLYFGLSSDFNIYVPGDLDRF